MEFLCVQILNSNRVDSLSSKMPRDMLDDKTWMKELLKQWNLEAPLPIPVKVLEQIKELREQMYLLLIAKSDDVNPINQLLNSVSTNFHLNVVQGNYELVQIYDAKGWDLVLWYIAKSFSDMLCNYDLSRIKICDNPDCGWVFYDTSKNKSRRWCSDKLCGNVMKVRRYREKQKQ